MSSMENGITRSSRTKLNVYVIMSQPLKDAFMTAARNVVYYNPDSHIAGYYRNLVKAGMSPLAATRRVARALVRVIYRRLSALTVGNKDKPTTGDEEHQEEGESGMASGSNRSGQSHTSDIPLSSPRNNKARSANRVKGEVTSTRKTNPGRRKIISRKTT